ncbi:MAG TPA: glycosyltransferase family 2 protein [Patescibacteria group bacterium]|nr:glycosyltransferase family 2 protein [Patescibacteria group bacterium]
MEIFSFKRLTELLPAMLIWLTFLLIILLSFIRPLWAIYFIIVFAVYWIVRLFYMMFWLIISWIRYRIDYKKDWLELVKNLDKNYLDYYHVVTYPTYKEPYEVIERSLQKLIDTDYPKDKMIVAIGGEERDKDNFLAIASKIEDKFGDKFFKLLITVHPAGIEGELPGKGSNVNYVEQQFKILIDELGFDYGKIIVSTFDIESLPHKDYFAYLTYKYLTHPNPTQASYQPLILYNNNIWQSNPIIRVVASATTFWLLTDLSRPERLLTFSSHSMSFKMLVDVGWHDKTIVTEDSRICLQGFVQYDGDYEVVPMFVTLSMDTVYIGSFWRGMSDQYKQMRRWAWGVEHFPWMWNNFFGKNANRRIPFKKRLRYLWNQTEGMYSWATAPLIILVVGRLPLLLASDAVKTTAFFQNAPITLERLMMAGMIGLVFNSIMYTFMLPVRPKGYALYNYLIMIIQWVIFPVTMIIFGSIPAIDAQTRLLLGGKYRLGFNVTQKKV